MGWGTCCCLGTSGPGDLCFTVMECCNRPKAGADIVVKNGGGTTVCSGTTDADGRFCCTSLAFDTYTYTVNPNDANYNSVGSTSVVHDANPKHVSVYLSLVSGLVCGPCDDPLPATLTLNDGFGDIALENIPGSSYYIGCATRTYYPIDYGPFAGDIYDAGDSADCSSTVTVADAGYGISIAVGFVLAVSCTGVTLWILLPVVTFSGSRSAPDISGDCAEFDHLDNYGPNPSINSTGVGGGDGSCLQGAWLDMRAQFEYSAVGCSPFEGEITGHGWDYGSYPGTPSNHIGWLQWIYGDDPVIFTYSE